MGITGRLCKEQCLETTLKCIDGGGESCVKRQIIPDCGCKVDEGSLPNSVENRRQSRRSWLVDCRVRLGCSSQRTKVARMTSDK